MNTTPAPARWPYYIAAALFLIVGYYFGWIQKDVLVLPSFSVALVCVIIGNLDKFKSFKAAGVEATLKDAQAAVQESRDLTLTVSKMLMSLVKRTGRLGGFPPAQEREFQESVERILKRVEATEAERKEAFKDWDLFTKIDFVFGLLGGNYVPKFPDDVSQQGQKDWKALRDKTGNDLNPATPDEVENFLRRYNFLDAEKKELVEDYRHFVKYSKHRRPEVWERRDEWANKKLGH